MTFVYGCETLGKEDLRGVTGTFDSIVARWPAAITSALLMRTRRRNRPFEVRPAGADSGVRDFGNPWERALADHIGRVGSDFGFDGAATWRIAPGVLEPIVTGRDGRAAVECLSLITDPNRLAGYAAHLLQGGVVETSRADGALVAAAGRFDATMAAIVGVPARGGWRGDRVRL